MTLYYYPISHFQKSKCNKFHNLQYLKGFIQRIFKRNYCKADSTICLAVFFLSHNMHLSPINAALCFDPTYSTICLAIFVFFAVCIPHKKKLFVLHFYNNKKADLLSAPICIHSSANTHLGASNKAHKL